MNIDKTQSLATALTGKSPILIAGPCSAESREQTLATAEQLSLSGAIHAFRSGVWKPRTRPGNFEGTGESALPWLQEVQRKYGIPAIVEVASPKHIELCLQHGIDHFWIGARSTVNPFIVEEIAQALVGHKHPLFIKNPINADIGLWLGACERLQRANVSKIVAIHRGFSNASETRYRNTPMWGIPIEFMRQCPELPMICDPSHIAGTDSLLFEVAQHAMDLGMRGLMVETHPTPKTALSDSAQQITPARLFQLIENLRVPKLHEADASNEAHRKQLHIDDLRVQIDAIDAELIQVLNRRMQVARRLGKLKMDIEMPSYQIERWNHVLRTRKQIGERYHLEAEFIQQLFSIIHEESINKQKQQSDMLHL